MNFMLTRSVQKGTSDFIAYSLPNGTELFKFRTGHTKYKLLDFTYNAQDDSVVDKPKLERQKLILLYNIPKNSLKDFVKRVKTKTCDFGNCVFTFDKSKIVSADAVIFYVGLRNERMGDSPPVSREFRNPNQVWIFSSIDSPVDYFNSDYEKESWHNTMNWSSLYRLDSDIPSPYGSLIRDTSSRTDKDYDSIYKAKTKKALWIARACQSASIRRQFVMEMVNQGFDVDVIGYCGVDGKQADVDMLERIIPSYKFYIAFETSLCNDYITERFFRNFNYNWIPVVRGGADYHRLLPPGTFIDTSDFASVSALVEYLNDLGNNKNKYNAYLREKDNYKSILHGQDGAFCEICSRLNNVSKFRKTYANISDYLNTGQCVRPTDL